MKIPLSNPDLTEKEIAAVNEVLQTPYLSIGKTVIEFENQFVKYIGVNQAIAVNSGTSGLHLCMKALDIKDGDEVITTPFSFIASANSILFERAKPVFLDIREDTYNLDEDKIESKITARTKAILPVHVFGYPCDMEKINKIARKHKLHVIEDACEAIGAEINGKKIGSFGDAAVFAFYPNKQMTTGEGGMIVTNDQKISDLCKSLRNQGRNSGAEWLAHDRLGYNYRLSEVSSALGVAQIKRIEELLGKREQVAAFYNSRLSDLPEVILPPRSSGGIKRSWFVYVLRLDNSFTENQRNEIITRLRADGIGCCAYFPPIHLQSFYIEQFGFKPGDFPVTERIAKGTIALPFYNRLTEEQVDRVVKSFKAHLQEVKKK